MSFLAQAFGFVLCVFLGLLGGTIVVWIWQGKIDLSALLSEPSGQASMSRFQLLLFSFVIAVSLFAMVEAQHSFPEIPSGVLTLLGISASTYAVSKGITYSQPQPTGTVVDDTAANAAADEAAGHAAVAQAAVVATQAAATQAAVHAATAQQAARVTTQAARVTTEAAEASAENAVVAQEAADQATGN